MLKNLAIEDKRHTDLSIYHCGEEICAPGHFYGPAVRDHFLIHYILDGQGIFQLNEQTYHLKKGQGFLICPDIITYYQADVKNPWHYTWVGFNGLTAQNYLRMANLTADTPIFTYNKDDYIIECFRKILKIEKHSKTKEIKLLGMLYFFLAGLIENSPSNVSINQEQNRKEFYANKVVEFIKMNYSRKVTISEIARYIGLDRSYLCSIFKEVFNLSPQEFLISYRINKACELMKNELLSIGDVSRSIGYDDTFLFSKTFKKAKGLSPSEYRKIILHN